MSRYLKTKIQTLINESDNASNTFIKGDKLEELIKYIFEKIENVRFYDKNILDSQRAHEIDLAFWNPNRKGNLSFLDPVIIIECKNHIDPIGSSEIGWFIRKLQDRGSNTGIFITLSGITGNSTGVDCACSEILNGMMRDKIKILLLNRDNLLSFNSTTDLINLLTEKYLKLTLYRSIE